MCRELIIIHRNQTASMRVSNGEKQVARSFEGVVTPIGLIHSYITRTGSYRPRTPDTAGET